MIEAQSVQPDESEAVHTDINLKRLSLFCIAITAGFGFTALIGWTLNWLFLAQLNPNNIPMAQSTAICFLMLSFALFAYLRLRENPIAIILAKACSLVIIPISLIILIDYLTGAGLNIERFIFPEHNKLNNVPIGRMSPSTAICFALSACSILFLAFPRDRHRVIRAAAFLGTTVTFIGLVFTIAYLYGSPLLYGITIVPMALTTAMAFTSLGIGISASAGYKYWPISSFAGSSVESRLVRVFIPATIAIVIISNWLNVLISRFTNNVIISNSLNTLFFVTFVSIIISRLSMALSKNIDRAYTEKQIAEQKHRASENKFLTSIENLIDPFGIYTAIRDKSGEIKDFRIDYVNNAACIANQMSKEEQIGKGLLEILPAHRETGLFEEYCDIVLTGQPFEREMLSYTDKYLQKKLTRSFDIRAVKMNDGFIASWRDTTEQNREKENLAFQANLLVLVNDAIIAYDNDLIITEWNTAAERIYGWQRQETLGQNIAQLLNTEFIGKTRNEFYQNLINIGKLSEVFIQSRKDGDKIFIEGNIISINNVSGKPIGYVTVNRDITQRNMQEEELAKYRGHLEDIVKMRTHELVESRTSILNVLEDLSITSDKLKLANTRLKELDLTKSMFIANMSHELRTPLNSIIGFSSILQDEWGGTINAEQKNDLEIIQKAGKHLLSLVNDIIDVAKIESGKIIIKYIYFDLNDVINDAVRLFEKEIINKGIELKVDTTHQQLNTDKRRLLQCLINIVGNAVKFTDGGFIKIETKMIKTGGLDNIEISVEDSGIGIRKEDIPKLFQSFVRLENELSRTVPGTGLGLYLTKKLVTDALNGKISVSSELGKGSRFVILIPIEPAKSAQP